MIVVAADMTKFCIAARANKREITPEIGLWSYIAAGEAMQHPLLGDIKTAAVRADIDIIEMPGLAFRAEPYAVIYGRMLGITSPLQVSYPFRRCRHLLVVKDETIV